MWSKNNSTSKYFIAIINGLLFGLLSGIKVYAGILIGLTLVIFWFIDFSPNIEKSLITISLLGLLPLLFLFLFFPC